MLFQNIRKILVLLILICELAKLLVMTIIAIFVDYSGIESAITLFNEKPHENAMNWEHHFEYISKIFILSYLQLCFLFVDIIIIIKIIFCFAKILLVANSTLFVRKKKINLWQKLKNIID